MRSVLVCVRSTWVADQVAGLAARLGLAAAVRTATSQPEVLLRLVEQAPEIVLADVALARSDIVGFTRRVLARAPGTALVLFGPDGRAGAALAAGARGLIETREPDMAGLVAKTLLLLDAAGPPEGRTVVPVQRDVDPAPDAGGPQPTTPSAGAGGPGVASTLASNGTTPGMLTEREAQVLQAMADGKSNAEIGRELYLSEDTIKTHARRIFRKLGARDRAHAVAAGFRAGLVG